MTWHNASEIAELATFIAATRPGFDIDTARARIKESGLPFDVRYIQIPALAISSTNIRKPGCPRHERALSYERVRARLYP